MIKQLLWFFLSSILLFNSSLVLAVLPKTDSSVFVLGTDYEIIEANSSNSLQVFPQKKDQSSIKIIEFFSYSCGACAALDPILTDWQQKAKHITFEKIPAVFDPSWELLARIFYVANTLEVEKIISPQIFSQLHQQHKIFANEQEVAEFFSKNGISKEKFDNIYYFSPSLDAKLARDAKLLKFYKIHEIPSIVVDGRFITSPRMVKGDLKRLLQLLDYLVERTRKDNRNG